MQTDNALFDMAHRLFGDLCQPRDLAAAEKGEWPAAMWDAVEAAGLPGALIPENAGGFGAAPAEALSVLRAAGEHALPLPLAETMIAGWLLAKAGLAIPSGALGIASADGALELKPANGGWKLTGAFRHVPWGRHVKAIAVLFERDGKSHVASIATAGAKQQLAENMAREPRDTLVFDTALKSADVSSCDVSALDLQALGAAMRSQQIAGAMNRITDMTVRYAQDRIQFGRPIGKFQAIQQNLAVLASQSAAANASADMAAEAVGEDGIGTLAVACAKVRCGEAASLGAPIAHQVHGAFGFTYEHSLHFYTKRLLSWRDEFGSEAEWSVRIGQAAITGGADQLWAGITAIGAARA